MPKLNPFVLAVLAVGAASGQRVEGTIWVPDSFMGVDGNSAIACNEASGLVYVGGEAGGSVVVLDAATGQKVARIPVGEFVVDIVCDTIRNRVYVSNKNGGTVTAIDGATHEVLATIPVGVQPGYLALNEAENKLYCANSCYGYLDSTISVIDCSRLKVVATIYVGTKLADICWNSQDKKVYCCWPSGSRLVVIDAGPDTVLRSIDIEGLVPHRLLYVARHDKLYCAGGSGLLVIDGSADTVLADIQTNTGPEGLCYNPVDDKVYAAGTIVDAAGDSLLVRLSMSSDAVCHWERGDKVYMSSYDRTWVVDGRGDSTLGTVDVGADAVFCSQTSDNVFCARRGAVSVIDCEADTVTVVHMMSVELAGLGWNPVRKRLYVSDHSPDCVWIVDAESHQLIGRIDLPDIDAFCYNSDRNVSYFGSSRRDPVYVVDASTDTIIGSFDFDGDGEFMAYDSAASQLYVAGSDEFGIVDGELDSILHMVELPRRALGICFARLLTKAFCGGTGERVYVIDGRLGRLTTAIPVGDDPEALACDPGGSKVYAAVPDADHVAVIDGSTNVLLGFIPVIGDPCDICVDPLRGKAFCLRNDSGDVIVIEMATDSVVAKIGLAGQASFGPLLCAPDLGQVYVVNRLDTTVVIIDTRGDSVLTQLRVQPQVIAMVVDVELSRLYVAGEGGGITIINTATGIREQAVVESRQMVYANLLQSRLWVPDHEPAVLLDITGRKVMELRQGANDIRSLSPGVYFVRGNSRGQGSEGSKVRKVVVTE
jgi:YVTN family beta-propeller protein